MTALFQFTPLRLDTPHNNLTTAIGLIQTHILAEQSDLTPEVMFGNQYWRTCLATAVALLAPMTDQVEDMTWEAQA